MLSKLDSGARALLLLSLLLSPFARAQQTPPPQTQQGEEVLRISSDLVQTDVTVLDKDGRFVDGLRREQFELKVDGRAQPIDFFERVTAGSSREATLVASRGVAPAASATPATATATADRGRTTLFFVDDLHLAPDSMKRTRDLLKNYVNNLMGPKDQSLIATASGQLGFLQQVTGNKEILRAAIERLTYRAFKAGDTLGDPAMNEYQAIAIERGDRDALAYFTDFQCQEFKRMDRGSCAPDTGMTNNAVFDDTTMRARPGSGGSGTAPRPSASSRRSVTGGGPGLRPEAERITKMRARIIARQAAQVTLNTLASLESLILTAAPIPERKLVIVVSDGFFLNFITSSNAYDMRRVTDAALRSGVVIYTADARGLVAGNIDATTRSRGDQQGRSIRLAMAEVAASQDALHALAEDTGGRAWRNSNDLTPGVTQAIQETSAYYLLAWRPEMPGQGKDNFRRIELRVKDRPDLVVRARGGFFADAGATASNASAAKPMTPREELLSLIRSSYPKRALPTTLAVGYMHANNAMSVAASMLVESAPGEAAEVDVLGAVVNDKGDVVASVEQHLSAATAARKGRLLYAMQFPNLAPGLYQVRVAARDTKTGRSGSAMQWVEVPDTSKGEFALGSVFLSEVPAGAAQKPSISPDNRFANSSQMRFQTQIFNASRTGASPDLSLQLQLSSNGQVMIETPPSPVSIQGVTDLARIPLTGEFPLAGFAPGRYSIKLTITDGAAKRSVAREAEFVVE